MKTATFEVMDNLGHLHSLTQKVRELNVNDEYPFMIEHGLVGAVIGEVFDEDGEQIEALREVTFLRSSDQEAINAGIRRILWTQESVDRRNFSIRARLGLVTAEELSEMTPMQRGAVRVMEAQGAK